MLCTYNKYCSCTVHYPCKMLILSSLSLDHILTCWAAVILKKKCKFMPVHNTGISLIFFWHIFNILFPFEMFKNLLQIRAVNTEGEKIRFICDILHMPYTRTYGYDVSQTAYYWKGLSGLPLQYKLQPSQV